MFSKYKNKDEKQNLSCNYGAKNTNALVALTKVLGVSSQQLKSKWCEQLLYKLHIIHNKFKNAHFSICLENLKVDKNNNLVLINVSDCQDKSLKKEASTQRDVRFKAPELIKCNEKSKAGDIWATGICIYFIINYTFPWKAATESDKNFCLWANNGTFPLNMNSCYTRVLNKMLCVDSEMRPSIKNVFRIMYDKGIDKNVISKLYLLKFYLKCFYFTTLGNLISMIAADYIKSNAYEQSKTKKFQLQKNHFLQNKLISPKQGLLCFIFWYLFVTNF